MLNWMHLILKCSFRYILESSSFELFFEYVELPNFDIASDALNTFKVNQYVEILFCVIWTPFDGRRINIDGRFDKIVAGSAYQARSCSCRVLGFPLRPGHYLVLRHLCSLLSMIKRQMTAEDIFLDKVSLKHPLTVESDNQHARYSVCFLCITLIF